MVRLIPESLVIESSSPEVMEYKDVVRAYANDDEEHRHVDCGEVLDLQDMAIDKHGHEHAAEDINHVDYSQKQASRMDGHVNYAEEEHDSDEDEVLVEKPSCLFVLK